MTGGRGRLRPGRIRNVTARIRDVAAQAGVSTQTVSRALRGSRAVTPTTAARIRAAAEDLSYFGNEAARTLRRGQTRTIGLLLPLRTVAFWPEVAAGTESLAHDKGYSLLLCDTSNSLEKDASYLLLLLRHRVAGVIYVQPRRHPATAHAHASLIRSRIPLVSISANPDDLPCTHVRTDDVRTGYVAGRHLHDLGCRRIAVVMAEDVDGALADRLLGLKQACQDVGGDLIPQHILGAEGTLEGGRAIGRHIVTEAAAGNMPWPAAIFATLDVLALGLLEAFRSQGVQVPDDIAVVGRDGLLVSSLAVPSLTTIQPPRREMGRACVDLLLRAQAGEALPPICMLEAQFLVRESTIGAGPMSRRGFSTPISAPEAWSCWRQQLPLATRVEHKRGRLPPVAPHTATRREEVTGHQSLY
jgi:LacI family transcriptional regulator